MMKTIFRLFCGWMAIAITACTSDELSQVEEMQNPTTRVVSVKAYTPSEHPDSRLAFEEKQDGSLGISWAEHDAFTVVINEQKYDFIYDVESAKFSAALPENIEIPNGTKAYYPAYTGEYLKNFSGQTGRLDSNVTYMEGTYDASSNAFSFEHSTAILKAAFTGLPNGAEVLSIKVSAEPYTITIPFSDDLDLASGIYIYLPAIAKDNEVEFNITTRNVGNYTATKKVNIVEGIKTGTFYTASIALTKADAVVQITLPNGVSVTNVNKVSLYDSSNGALIGSEQGTFTELPSFDVPTTIGGGLILVETTDNKVYKAEFDGNTLEAGQSYSFGQDMKKATPQTSSGNVKYASWNNDAIIYYGSGAMRDLNSSPSSANFQSNTRIFILEGVTTIGNYTFYVNSQFSCNASVIISNTVTSIGSYAFGNCGFTSVTIPNSVTSIGYSAFAYCKKLENITIPASVTNIGDYAFNDCRKLARITLPASVTSIGNYAFNCCESLESITIPASVTNIGDYAFNDCRKLARVTLPASVTSIGNCAFANCELLSNITLPASVTRIEQQAFYRAGLTSITLPANVWFIGNEAFYDCSSLTSVTLERNSLVTLKVNPFPYYSSLESIFVPSDLLSRYKAEYDSYYNYFKAIPSSGETD